ncbi:ATP-binding protein [Legionella worsleiensis]|uniref:histidine kinase n=1 Tax=Legionella worsleiensis TaxID=45076 RepID=A0A0W1AKP6_9GAMM|nr:ATP-binding protein [Legionella worsleiensis]KTD81935.1 sensor histidine kinase [Legionella worsleiensis]STY31284.1 sensor histidine kinase [Legionella worsleiensis]
MSWKFANSMSIINRLLLIFIVTTVLILSVITVLVYPPLKKLLYLAHQNQEYHHFVLAQICIKKFFIGLWISALILICASCFMAKKSMKPLDNFSEELASINASSLDKRLKIQGYPQELQQLAATCNAMLFRIESAFRHIKQFSASMAHELRNPVHYLKTATEITLAKPQSVETYQNLLYAHLDEFHHLTQLVDNLLFLTRSEHGQIPLHRKQLSAKTLISSITDFYHFTAVEHRIDINIEGDALIKVDEHLFKRVIANILDNSLAHTKSGGSIHIKTEKTHQKTLISVKDNGTGIAKEHLPLLCQGFYKANHSEDKETTGLGLGLAIAKAIMNLHHGEINIQSQPTLGTVVTLVLNNEINSDTQ